MIRASVVAVLALALPAFAETCDREAVVRQNFPSALKPGPSPSEHAFDWTCADLDGHGSADTLVAAYSDGNAGVVRILRRSGDAWLVIAEEETVAALKPEVSTLDIDADHRLEVVVAGQYRPDAKEYSVFRWDGTKLVDITPLTPSREVERELGTSEFIDVDGDGRLEFVMTYRCHECPPDLFKLRSDGTFGSAQSPLYLRIVTRGKGAPNTIEDSFTVADPAGAFEMQLGVQGQVPPTSGVIRLNGTVVATPDDFRKGSRSLRIRNVPILHENTLSVELRGEPGSALAITILATPPTP
jgi:hypothetical protein